MNVDQLEAFLSASSCFGLLNDEQLSLVCRRAELKQYKLGEVVFRQGDVGDAMYVIYSGRIRVIQESDGIEVPLNLLSTGEHFGELALVSNAPRSATIRAAADSTLIRVPEEAVRDLLKGNEPLRHYFEQYADQLELWNFLKTAAQLGVRLKPAQLRELVDRFRSMTFTDGQTIQREDELPERFHVVQSGHVSVERGGERQVTLGAGDTLGGGSLVQSPVVPSEFTVIAKGPVTTLALSAEHFAELVTTVPEVRRFFQEQAIRRDGNQAEARIQALAIAQTARTDDRGVPAESILAADESATGVTTPQQRPEELAPAATAAEPPLAEEELPPAKQLSWWGRFRFPFVPQHEEVDCGAAALAMVTSYPGCGVGVSRLRDMAGVTTVGASLLQLAKAARDIGYVARSLQLTSDRLSTLRLPAVLFWNGYHYVVLYGLTDRWAYVADPAIGKMRISRDELERSFSGYALELAPTDEAQRIRPRMHSGRRLMNLLGRNKRFLGAILVSSLLLDVLGLAPAILTQRIVDAVLPSGELSLLNLVAGAMLVVALVEIGMTMARGFLAVRLSQTLDREMLGAFYKHLLALPTRFFKLRRTGDIVARFADNQNVRDLFTAER